MPPRIHATSTRTSRVGRRAALVLTVAGVLAVPTTAEARPGSPVTAIASCPASTSTSAAFVVTNSGAGAAAVTWQEVGGLATGAATLAGGGSATVLVPTTRPRSVRLDVRVAGKRIDRVRGCRSVPADDGTVPWPAVAEPAVVPLTDGRVLVAGGYDSAAPGAPTPLAAAYLCLPATSRCRPTAPLPYVPAFRAAGLQLPDGRVLLVSGVDAATTPEGLSAVPVSWSETFDPATQSWTGGPFLEVPRYAATLVALDATHVLVAGGVGICRPPTRLCISPRNEVIDLVTGESSVNFDMPAAHPDGSAALLADGRVLLVAGRGSFATVAPVDTTALPSPLAVEVFDPATQTWSLTDDLPSPRPGAVLTRLPSGLVRLHSSSGPDLVWSPASGHWATA